MSLFLHHVQNLCLNPSQTYHNQGLLPLRTPGLDFSDSGPSLQPMSKPTKAYRNQGSIFLSSPGLGFSVSYFVYNLCLDLSTTDPRMGNLVQEAPGLEIAMFI